MRAKRLLLAALTALLALLLSGCFVKTVDELYTLPQHSDDYNRLEQAIESVMSAQSAVYAAPVSGINQQSVQLADLDGDGQEEAVAFLKTTGDKPLKAYIFSVVDGDYQPMDVIEGDGTSFASVEYAPLTGGPGVEILITRQLSTDVLQSLCAYTYSGGHVVELMSTGCTAYRTADLDEDGRTDLFVLHSDAERQQGIAELYRWRDGQMEREPEVSLSAAASDVRRILIGDLTADVPAVFVASGYEDGSLVTDVFAFRGGTFRNLTAAGSGGGISTVRNYYVYAADIDEDGRIELPDIHTLPSAADSEESFSVIDWYNLSLNAVRTHKCTTYHNFSGGWYLTLPDAWQDQLCIVRSAEVGGVRGYTFCRWDGSAVTEQIFTIYAFSGDNRTQTASADGRFILAEKGDITYAAQLGTGKWAKELSEDGLKAMFRFIHIDWNSGET